MGTESIALRMPYMLPYDGIAPHFATPPLLAGPGSSVLGKVQVGARATFGTLSVVRADGHYVRIGDDFCLAKDATVHIAHEIYPTIIGDRVAVGQNAVVHACTVGNDCVIEANAVVLDGSVVEDRVVIEAGSVVFPRSILKSGYVYAGSPAKPVRELPDDERKQRDAHLRDGVAASLLAPATAALREADGSYRENFVARTASLRGHVDLKARSSVFFSCVLKAGQGTIAIGENSNIQDNTRIRSELDDVVIGRDTTLGHNVDIRDCRIGERCLIGIGSSLAHGTVVENDVLLAAGSTTAEGQRLESGWLWAGRPARPLSRLDDAKRTMMALIIEQYCGYADEFRRLQNSPG
jgi:carbonic anhydrase/acetyltransferase-like protein (isoleucine patch superfamily)